MENPYWHDEVKPHFVNFDEVRANCFRAFAILAASRYFMGLSSEDYGGDLHDLYFQRAEPELSTTLLSLAVGMRTFEDVLTANDDRDEYDKFVEASFEADEFGSMGVVGDAPDAPRQDLSFRESCNKIIHANDIRPVYDNGDNDRDGDYGWGMDGTLELTGKQGKREWDVWLDIEAFLGGCLTIADKFRVE